MKWAWLLLLCALKTSAQVLPEQSVPGAAENEEYLTQALKAETANRLTWQSSNAAVTVAAATAPVDVGFSSSAISAVNLTSGYVSYATATIVLSSIKRIFIDGAVTADTTVANNAQASIITVGWALDGGAVNPASQCQLGTVNPFVPTCPLPISGWTLSQSSGTHTVDIFIKASVATTTINRGAPLTVSLIAP